MRACGAVDMRRLEAVRRLLTRRQVRESLVLAPQPGWRIGLAAGAQAALAAAIALPLVALSPFAHLIGFASLGSLVALFGRFAPRGQRSGIVLQCLFWQTMAVAVVSMAAWLGAPVWAQLLLVSAGGGAFYFISMTGRFGPPGALIFVFAASASMGQAVTFIQVAERSAAVLAVGLLAWAICLLTDRWRYRHGGDADLPPDPVHPLHDRWRRAAQIAVASAIAAFIAHGSGAAHPAWAAMGAVAVMQGTHLHLRMNRALQRVVGTGVGAGLVWLVLIQGPSVWVVIPLIVGLMVATELVIGSNYGIGQVLITPMALLMTFLAAPGARDLGMVPERVLDTLIGAGVAMLLAIVLSTAEDRLHLSRHHDDRSM